jgi:hypothetical protein
MSRGRLIVNRLYGLYMYKGSDSSRLCDFKTHRWPVRCFAPFITDHRRYNHHHELAQQHGAGGTAPSIPFTGGECKQMNGTSRHARGGTAISARNCGTGRYCTAPNFGFVASGHWRSSAILQGCPSHRQCHGAESLVSKEVCDDLDKTRVGWELADRVRGKAGKAMAAH